MSHRLFCTLFLLACSITLPGSAAAQVFVESHTNIETDAAGNRTLVASCRTQMLDGNTLANYPSAESICNLNENGNLIQTVTCGARSDAFLRYPDDRKRACRCRRKLSDHVKTRIVLPATDKFLYCKRRFCRL